jgi:hypothetical protein
MSVFDSDAQEGFGEGLRAEKGDWAKIMALLFVPPHDELHWVPMVNTQNRHWADTSEYGKECGLGLSQSDEMHNVFNALLRNGHDDDFEPKATDMFVPTDAPAGSPEKLKILYQRADQGLPLWHPEDSASIIDR